MGEIIARWEFRTFADDLGEAEKNIKENYECTLKRESSEVYILSRHSMNNTKVRDDLMDIKIPKEIDENKLEQWYPLMKAGFPVSPKVLKTVYENWNIDAPDFKRDEYTYDQFMSELVDPNPDLTAVNVFKERHGYMINECIVELAYLKFNDQPIKTMAVELADTGAVMKTVKELKLDTYENINYLKALKSFAGM
jgi:hypothetical protein